MANHEILLAHDQLIETRYQEFMQASAAMLESFKKSRSKKKWLAAFQACHAAARAYFNACEQAIVQDARLNQDGHPTCYTDRVDNSVNALQTMREYFRFLRKKCEYLEIEYSMHTPSIAAYASMQRRVSAMHPTLAAEFRKDFVDLELPTFGFDNPECQRPQMPDPEPRDPQNVHYHGDVMNIKDSNFQGSNVAIGKSTVTGSTATYSSNSELTEALKTLTPMLGTVAAEQRQAVEAALQVLAEATEGNKNIPVAQVVTAVETITKASPTMRERLKDISGRLALSLTGSAIFQGIKSYFGIH